MKKIINFLIIAIISLEACNTNSGGNSVLNGNIIGSAWYNPEEKSSLYIRDNNIAIYTFYSGSIYSNSSTKILTKELNYSFNANQKRLNFPSFGMLEDFDLSIMNSTSIGGEKSLGLVNGTYQKGWLYLNDDEYINRAK